MSGVVFAPLDAAPAKNAAALDRLAEAATRHLFFTGKGGVGKTSVACALAVRLADAGRRVLLVSTDPASNLDEVLGVRLSAEPTEVPGVAGLRALNIDPEAEAAAYRERVVGPYRDVLPAAAVASMEEQLSGACTTEIAAFDRFSALLGDPGATSGYDHIVFDTAPTGHTLRLLTLPSAWTGFIQENTTGVSCLGPLQGLEGQRALYEATVEALADPGRTTVVLVTRPEEAPIREAERTRLELAALGIRNQRLVLNGVFRAAQSTDSADAVARAMEERGERALASMPSGLATLPRVEIPLRPINILGVDALRTLDHDPVTPVAAANTVENVIDAEDAAHGDDPSLPPLSELIDELEAAGHGVVMTLGKGGVGKTTLASAIAVALAERGHRVHLTTTDPAAHVADTVGAGTAKLRVSRIDPVAETRAYTEHVLETAGKELDADGLALLEEDLRSPCTEEVAVFHAFARVVAEGAAGFVVLDTAPTGHTLLLLDSSEAYHREVDRSASALPEHVRNLLPRLRDPDYTRVLVVTLAEPTPVHEAQHLQEDLRRAGIQPFGWIVNRSLAVAGTREPVLRARGRAEMPLIRVVREELAERAAIVPWSPVEPVGAEALLALAEARARTRRGSAPELEDVQR